MAQSSGPRTFIGLQFGRGIAALLVTSLHAQQIISLPQFGGQRPFGGLFSFGQAGVDFFFVLSGFIIFHVHQGDVGRRRSLFRYAAKRLTRIFPLYWIVMVPVTVKYLLVTQNIDFGFWLKSVMLLPQSREPLLPASWTLSHEMIFYLCFGVLIWSKRLGVLVLGLWFAYIVADMPPQGTDFSMISFSSPYNLLFFAGMVVAGLTARGTLLHPVPVAIAGFVVFAGAAMFVDAGYLEPGGIAGIASFGFASTLMVAGLVGAERAGAVRYDGVWRKLGERCGSVSYPLYLIHGAVLSPMIFILGSFLHAPPFVTFLCSVSSAVVAGFTLHVWVERPLISHLHRGARLRVVPVS